VGNGMGWFRPYKYDFDSWQVPGFYASELWPLFREIENVTGTPYLLILVDGKASFVIIITYYCCLLLLFYLVCNYYHYSWCHFAVLVLKAKSMC